jgi:large subunit ribosomal protein L2
MVKEGNYALIRLPSTELRKISVECCATIGQIGNIEHSNVSLGKAGPGDYGLETQVKRYCFDTQGPSSWGGSGRSPIGMPGPKSPWGKPTLGYKTRKKKASDKLIVRRREK